MRQIAAIAIAVCAAVLATGCGSSSKQAQATTGSGPSTSPSAGRPTCESQEQAGIAANFGFRRTAAAAQTLVGRASHVGFQNLAVQQRGCRRYAVVLTGLMNMSQAHAFEREAAGAGFPVVIECRSAPPRGELAVVFGHRRSHQGAVVLMRAASAQGFQNLQVQQDRCDDWEVVLYGAETAQQRRALRREAAAVGYRVTFEPG